MPAYKTKTFPVASPPRWLDRLLQTGLAILAVNWVCQGMRGMDAGERRVRLVALLLLTAAMGAIATQAGAGLAAALLGGLVVAHTIGFTLNGQFWVCARYSALYRRSPQAVQAHARGLERRLRRIAWLDEAVCIGSLATGQPASARPDIDLRLIRPAGRGRLAVDGLAALLRAEAFLRAIPRDLYVYDRPSSLRRLRGDEPLRVILDRGGRIAAALPDRRLMVAPWTG
jgi:hypothetical protein